ncbi:hypothetical protein ABFS82_04G053500 [Erythranthe guttata]|uniref:Transmembrane protein n=1 Tax=Erythranthe guttata TaxID=4155 RepID=A0A022S237_ERYGU|nr:hypothetical protein MIMGU_mgv1a017128mg [Erythranthe guttata]
MRNNHNKTLVFLVSVLLILFLDSTTCFATHLSHKDAVFREKNQYYSRKLMIVSANTLPVSKGNPGEAMVEPEKAVVNGLRKKPPTASNPTQN